MYSTSDILIWQQFFAYFAKSVIKWSNTSKSFISGQWSVVRTNYNFCFLDYENWLKSDQIVKCKIDHKIKSLKRLDLLTSVLFDNLFTRYKGFFLAYLRPLIFWKSLTDTDRLTRLKVIFTSTYIWSSESIYGYKVLNEIKSSLLMF